jgi:hypothetical protein
MRRQKEVNEGGLARAGRYQTLKENQQVKEVWVADRRYVVCRNPFEAAKDETDREAIIDKLKATIRRDGPKTLIVNRGCARFPKVDKDSVSNNPNAGQADARLDGKFVLTTNTALPAHTILGASKGSVREIIDNASAERAAESRAKYSVS